MTVRKSRVRGIHNFGRAEAEKQVRVKKRGPLRAPVKVLPPERNISGKEFRRKYKEGCMNTHQRTVKVCFTALCMVANPASASPQADNTKITSCLWGKFNSKLLLVFE